MHREITLIVRYAHLIKELWSLLKLSKLLQYIDTLIGIGFPYRATFIDFVGIVPFFKKRQIVIVFKLELIK